LRFPSAEKPRRLCIPCRCRAKAEASPADRRRRRHDPPAGPPDHLHRLYYLGSRKYYFIALLILLETMLPFGLVFESRKPQARELMVIAVPVRPQYCRPRGFLHAAGVSSPLSLS
jgi:hypothetical protein